MPIVGVSSERTERGEFVNAGLSDCCVWANTLLGGAESIAFQVFMLYSLSPPGMLISSCQPLTFPDPRAHLSPISSFIIPFLKTTASLSLAPSHPSYSRPTRLYLFLLTSLSFFPVFQPRLLPPSFSATLAHHPAHFPCPPFLPSPAVLLSLRDALAAPESTSLFLFLLLFFRVCDPSTLPDIIHLALTPYPP